MRGGGGRTRSRGSLRGERKRAEKETAAKGTRRLRSGSGADRTSAPGRRLTGLNPPKGIPATGVAVASVTSSKKSTPAKKKRKHLEAFVPVQRHPYGEERIFLPCPGSPR
jgi:hypothetical protein